MGNGLNFKATEMEPYGSPNPFQILESEVVEITAVASYFFIKRDGSLGVWVQ